MHQYSAGPFHQSWTASWGGQSGQQVIMVWSLDLASLCSDKWTQLVICHQQVVAFCKQLKVSSWVWTAPFCKFAIPVEIATGLQVWSSCNLFVFFVDCCGLTLCSSGPSKGGSTTSTQLDFSPHTLSPTLLDTLLY